IGVMTHADRHCLYSGVVDAVYSVPDDFYTKFRRGREVFFGLRGVSATELSDYFVKRINSKHELKGFFGYKIKWDKIIFKPYSYSKALNGKKEIIILPRCREAKAGRRNLPKSFYVRIIDILCDKYPNYLIRTIGIPSGAYSINGIKRANYVNGVQEGADLQELIDRCQVAVVAIGSQSAPPKITLLQGIPTFMVGHQEERHMRTENWMSTKVGFYNIPKYHYDKLDSADCINKLMTFVEECQ
ncbi:hypothetical protein KA005_82115, partial [bacterium]|nr:hypothetical protein [bacterium]